MYVVPLPEEMNSASENEIQIHEMEGCLGYPAPSYGWFVHFVFSLNRNVYNMRLIPCVPLL